MSNATAPTTRDWVTHYRTLTAHELIARTLSLQLSAKRGSATEVEERFAALEAEQARRAASAAYWEGINAADRAFRSVRFS